MIFGAHAATPAHRPHPKFNLSCMRRHRGSLRTAARHSTNTHQVGTGMAFNPAGTKAFIAVFPNQLYVVDTATLAITAKIPVGQAPSVVALTIDGSLVSVTREVQPGTWWIDARKNTLIGHSVAAGASGGGMGLLIVQ